MRTSTPVGTDRPEVREDAELLAEPQQTLLRPHGGALELGRADRREQYGVGDPARGQRVAGGSGSPVSPDPGPAEGPLVEVERQRQRAESTNRLPHHLRPDAVAAQADDFHAQPPRGVVARHDAPSDRRREVILPR